MKYISERGAVFGWRPFATDAQWVVALWLVGCVSEGIDASTTSHGDAPNMDASAVVSVAPTRSRDGSVEEPMGAVDVREPEASLLDRSAAIRDASVEGEAADAAVPRDAGDAAANGFLFVGEAIEPDAPGYGEGRCIYEFRFDASPRALQCFPVGHITNSHAARGDLGNLTYTLLLDAPDVFPEYALRTDIRSGTTVMAEGQLGFTSLGGTPFRIVLALYPVNDETTLVTFVEDVRNTARGHGVSVLDAELEETVLRRNLTEPLELHGLLPSGAVLLSSGEEVMLFEAAGVLRTVAELPGAVLDLSPDGRFALARSGGDAGFSLLLVDTNSWVARSLGAGDQGGWVGPRTLLVGTMDRFFGVDLSGDEPISSPLPELGYRPSGLFRVSAEFGVMRGTSEQGDGVAWVEEGIPLDLCGQVQSVRTIEMVSDGDQILALFDDTEDTSDFSKLGTIHACDRHGYRGDLLSPYGLEGRLLSVEKR